MYLTLSSSSGSMYRRPTDQNEAAVSKKRDTPEVTDVQITPGSLKVITYNAETWAVTDEFEIQKTADTASEPDTGADGEAAEETP